MAGEIDEIRARIDIVDLVGQRVLLKKKGRNFEGLCPFHDDKRPSFTVNPSMQRYKCWSCGEGGDIFTWVEKTLNVDFREALEVLAKQAGVTLSKRGTDAAPKSDRSLNLEIMESASSFFREQLTKSSLALDYLRGRGIDDDAIEKWELGYAPDVGEALAVYLQKKGYSLSLCRTLFLVEEDTSGGYFDKFRGRLMFPIRDERNALVAFGGRLLGDGLPKYINSSDTPVYRKSRVLYGLNRAGASLAKAKPRQIVLCEGYLDVIACHRAGVTGAVASLGTALSEEHAKLLKRWCDEVVILYDADAAGQKAADRALEVLKPENVPVSIALMPSGDDPDTLLRRAGPTAVVEAVKKAVPPTAFRIERVVANHPEKTDQFWGEVVEVLAQGSDVMEIQQHIQRLVGAYSGVNDPRFVMDQLQREVMKLRKGGPRAPRSTNAAPIKISVGDLTASEATLISALLTPGLRTLAHEALVLPDLFVSEPGRTFSNAYLAAFGQNPPTGEPSTWVSDLDPAMVDAIERCSADPRFASINDRFVKDAVAKLVSQLEMREFQLMKRKEDPDKLSKIRSTLERIKNVEK